MIELRYKFMDRFNNECDAMENKIISLYPNFRDAFQVIEKFRSLRRDADIYLKKHLFVTKFQFNRLWSINYIIHYSPGMSDYKIRIHNSAARHFIEVLRNTFPKFVS